MFKIYNNTAIREDVPSFLKGLSKDSLFDLSWTDPSLGVSELAWYDEIDESLPLNHLQKYEGETITIDHENKIVKVIKSIVPLTEKEIEEKRNRLKIPAEAKIAAETILCEHINSEECRKYIAQLALVPQQENYPWEINWPIRPIY